MLNIDKKLIFQESLVCQIQLKNYRYDRLYIISYSDWWLAEFMRNTYNMLNKTVPCDKKLPDWHQNSQISYKKKLHQTINFLSLFITILLFSSFWMVYSRMKVLPKVNPVCRLKQFYWNEFSSKEVLKTRPTIKSFG